MYSPFVFVTFGKDQADWELWTGHFSHSCSLLARVRLGLCTQSCTQKGNKFVMFFDVGFYLSYVLFFIILVFFPNSCLSVLWDDVFANWLRISFSLVHTDFCFSSFFSYSISTSNYFFSYETIIHFTYFSLFLPKIKTKSPVDPRWRSRSGLNLLVFFPN